MAWLPDGAKISKISLVVLAQLTNVTDGRTDGWTNGQTDRRTQHAGNSRRMHSIAQQKSSDFDKKFCTQQQILNWMNVTLRLF